MNPVLFQVINLRMDTVRLLADRFGSVPCLAPHLNTVRLCGITPHIEIFSELSCCQFDNLLRIHLIHIQFLAQIQISVFKSNLANAVGMVETEVLGVDHIIKPFR